MLTFNPCQLLIYPVAVYESWRHFVFVAQNSRDLVSLEQHVSPRSSYVLLSMDNTIFLRNIRNIRVKHFSIQSCTCIYWQRLRSKATCVYLNCWSVLARDSIGTCTCFVVMIPYTVLKQVSCYHNQQYKESGRIRRRLGSIADKKKYYKWFGFIFDCYSWVNCNFVVLYFFSIWFWIEQHDPFHTKIDKLTGF